MERYGLLVPCNRYNLILITVIFMLAVTFSSQLQALEIPFYGNWCGLGVPGNGQPPAVDEIDAACRVHDHAYERFPDSEADGVLANTVAGILQRGHQWVRRETTNGQATLDRGVELTDHQFKIASAIIALLTGQQILTLTLDILDGKLSAAWKLPSSVAVRSVTVPSALANKLANELARELDVPPESLTPFLEAADWQTEFVLQAAHLTDGAIDEVGDDAEAFVTKIGDGTGLRKPVREAKEEILLVINHPKKVPDRLWEKTGDLIEEAWDAVTKLFK